MSPIRPADVRSPKAHWQLIEVLLDRGPGDCAYALGEWDGERRIGFRWNGDNNNPIGNPQSRGLPTWTMLDPKLHDAVISVLPADKQSLARRFLGTSLDFVVSVSPDRVSILLWDVRFRPPVVAKIECKVIRDIAGRTDISEDDCRLLAETNKDALTEIAEALFAQKRIRLNDNQAQVIDIGVSDLKPIARRFSTTVLDLRPRWGV